MEKSALLAHLDRDSGRVQTLSAHSRNVASYCEKSCGKIGLPCLGRLTGLLHDSGKGAPVFQRYLQSGDSSLRGQIPHAFCVARYFYETHGIDGSVRGLTAQLAAAAVCGHHGGLPDVTGVTAEDNLHRRAWPSGEADYSGALENYLRECASRAELESLFQEAQREVGGLCARLREICEKVPASGRTGVFYFFLGLVQRYLSSCLIDADRYDTYLFAAGGRPEQEQDRPALWSLLAGRLEERLKAFPSETPLDRKRQEISNQCLAFSGHGAGIYRLSVPTGSGKTLSSLRYALNCAKENDKERIFYVAPYKSILDQNAADIRAALCLDDSGDSILLEHHSDVVVDDKSSEEIARYSLLTQRWDPPIVLTTAVQFLNTLFDGRSSCVRRMHSLANSVIILDEVQAMPVPCTYLVNAALDFLAYACNCAVVLCTATQPTTEEMEIPVITGVPAQMTGHLEQTFADFRRVRAVDLTEEGALSAARLADFIVDRLSSCDNLLAILNTKSAAKALYRALKKRMAELPPEQRSPVCFLSTSLCPQHRMDRIKTITRSLADKTPGGNRLVCVSTQLIEAGVNLSFQCAVRSLAGLDSIAQAAGRCNRHGESARRDVFIVRCAEENLASLPDIQRAQEAADHVLQDFRSNPAQFGGDLLSPSAVKRYYHYYYELQKIRLPYPVCEKDDPKLFSPTSLLDLLSYNSLARKACTEHGGVLPEHPMHQAFETAGKIFAAIENSGLNVIVPYGEGEELIRRLSENPGIGELPRLLRRAQRCTVHLSDGERIRLERSGAIELLPDIGAAVLRGEFYSPELGVQMQRGEMEFLNY